ncbi:MAG: ribosome biogenesis GTP-binding protein YihA/YsxC [Gemmatimonadales bacterium]
MPPRPEFALIGRSNVGKSSLLNAMAGRRSLARISATPGKTQLLNVYSGPELYLIDLPGYGFARASREARQEYRTLLHDLLSKRDTLTGVIWLLDVRHPISADDRDFGELLAEGGRPVLPVLTKCDKLSRAPLAAAVTERAREIGFDADEIQPVSARTGDGIADLVAAVRAAARPGNS